jgi:hypothetical protein
MPPIEAVKYGLVGLAALFGLWAAVKVKAPAHGASEARMRLANRFMLFSIVLVLLSGLLAVYEFYLLGGGRRAQESQIISRMDQTIAAKLGIENDAFAAMDAYSRQTIDNIIRQLCRDVIDLSDLLAASPAARCKARLGRPPAEAPT